jgi:hypothetical protein
MIPTVLVVQKIPDYSTVLVSLHVQLVISLNLVNVTKFVTFVTLIVTLVTENLLLIVILVEMEDSYITVCVLNFVHLLTSLTLLPILVMLVTLLVLVVTDLMNMNVDVVIFQDSYLKDLVQSLVQMELMLEKTHSQENVLLVTLIV